MTATPTAANQPAMPTIDRPWLMLGDCLERMQEIPDGSVDMVLCDLPYGTTQNRWDAVIPLDPLWEQYWRCLKPSGVVALNASQPFASTLVGSQPRAFRHEWIWLKNMGSNFANTVREPFKEHESVLIFAAGRWTYNRQMQNRSGAGVSRARYGDKTNTKTPCYGEFTNRKPADSREELRVPSSYQKFNVQRGLHPTQKPVPLFEYLIRTYTNEGEAVLDNCFGSGTSGVACINTGRRFIGIERDPNYFDIGRRRIDAAIAKAAQPAPFGGLFDDHKEAAE